MIKRTLGNSGLTIAPLAFGGNVFGWTADEATSFQLFDAFVAAGFTRISIRDGRRAIKAANRSPSSAAG